MVDSSTQSIVITAPRSSVVEVISDFARYPEWISGMRSSRVLEEFDDGYAAVVEFELDAGVFKDSYALRYEYAEDLSWISWSLERASQVQKQQDGSYTLTENEDGTTTVTYTLAVDLSIPMLGMFKRKAEKAIMDSALKDLRKRVEAGR